MNSKLLPWGQIEKDSLMFEQVDETSLSLNWLPVFQEHESCS